jgi:prepilin-type N-terminal cleavage/methylation domain-containing protein
MKNIKEQNGYSLLEMMLAIALFSFVMLIVLNIFQSIMASQRNTISSQNIQENMAYALEVMSKEIRQAQVGSVDCVGNFALLTSSTIVTSSPTNNVYNSGTVNGRDIFYFQKKQNNNDYCVFYLWVSVGSIKRLAIIRIKNDSPSTIDALDFITPDEINIGYLHFYIKDSQVGMSLTEQPYVTMVIKAESVKGDPQPTYFQTSISARAYEE